ncbi:unnamed protein product [Symbiodinium sp. CCMP2456]|nr:unnamed protein product [Symbiodinium sp. CCMP2456]
MQPQERHRANGFGVRGPERVCEPGLPFCSLCPAASWIFAAIQSRLTGHAALWRAWCTACTTNSKTSSQGRVTSHRMKMRKIGLHARVAALQQVQEAPPEATEANYICIWNSWHLFICVVCTACVHRVLETFREHVTDDCETITEAVTPTPVHGRNLTLQMWHKQTTPSSCWDGAACIEKKAQIPGASAGSRHGSGRITLNFGLLSLQRLRIWTGRCCKDCHVMGSGLQPFYGLGPLYSPWCSCEWSQGLWNDLTTLRDCQSLRFAKAKGSK